MVMEVGHGICSPEQRKREGECLVPVCIQNSQAVCRLCVILDTLYESKPTWRLRNLPTCFTARNAGAKIQIQVFLFLKLCS